MPPSTHNTVEDVGNKQCGGASDSPLHRFRVDCVLSSESRWISFMSKAPWTCSLIGGLLSVTLPSTGCVNVQCRPTHQLQNRDAMSSGGTFIKDKLKCETGVERWIYNDALKMTGNTRTTVHVGSTLTGLYPFTICLKTLYYKYVQLFNISDVIDVLCTQIRIILVDFNASIDQIFTFMEYMLCWNSLLSLVL